MQVSSIYVVLEEASVTIQLTIDHLILIWSVVAHAWFQEHHGFINFSERLKQIVSALLEVGE